MTDDRLEEKRQAMLTATADYHAARREVEDRCPHARATKAATEWGIEVRCPDCEQIWSLSFGGIHCSETGEPSIRERWRRFLDRFVACAWHPSHVAPEDR